MFLRKILEVDAEKPSEQPRKPEGEDTKTGRKWKTKASTAKVSLARNKFQCEIDNPHQTIVSAASGE